MKKNILLMIINMLAGTGLFATIFLFFWLTTNKDFLEIFMGDMMLIIPMIGFMYSYMKSAIFEEK